MSKEVIATGKDRIANKKDQNALIDTVKELKLGYSPAIKILRHQQQFEEEVIEIGRVFKGIPFADAALAISKAMQETFHLAAAKKTEGTFFSPEHPPRIMQVDAGPNGERVGVPMGNFEIPMLDDAKVSVDRMNDGECFFTAIIKRKYSVKMEEMLDLAEILARKESLYRGKALRFTREEDDKGKFHDIISFMQLGSKETLILPRHTQVHMQANLWTPIQKPELVAKLGVPLKRAMLLYGQYGVGKTLAAHATAHISLENARTFIYVDHSRHLAKAYEFADQLSPSVLFVEDIDQMLDDSTYLGILANVLDGVTSKGAGVYLVATTNHIDKIPPVLLRPGRFDMHLELTVPDEPAIRELIKLYAPQITGTVDAAVKALTGQIPAIIRECCERAKLYCLTHDDEGVINGIDLADAAEGMKQEMARIQMANKTTPELSNGDVLADSLQKVMANGSGKPAATLPSPS